MLDLKDIFVYFCMINNYGSHSKVKSGSWSKTAAIPNLLLITFITYDSFYALSLRLLIILNCRKTVQHDSISLTNMTHLHDTRSNGCVTERSRIKNSSHDSKDIRMALSCIRGGYIDMGVGVGVQRRIKGTRGGWDVMEEDQGNPLGRRSACQYLLEQGKKL